WKVCRSLRIIPKELSPYTQFEIEWGYTINASAGEDIRFILTSQVPDVPFGDTWLFDDKIAVDINYDKQGRPLSATRRQDSKGVSAAVQAWHQFYAASFPLRVLLARLRTSPRSIPISRR